MRILILISAVLMSAAFSCKENGRSKQKAGSHEINITISKQYLNLPVSGSAERSKIHFTSDGIPDLEMVMRLAAAKPDYWVFLDVSAYNGRKLKISYQGDAAGLASIYQDDVIAGNDSLYKEVNRPQLHFTSRRGWNNDPNGLVYYDGVYHLFYQHNPLEREWENMSWGHATSNDLVHWKELPLALLPDTLGAMFSGSAIIDKDNASGWGRDAMVLFYTAAGKKMQQCIAYSTDNGLTFKKFVGNPVLGPDRDPKVFWHEPSKRWVLVLYNENYNAIYNSTDLKHWEYKSRVDGFFECPELFELNVDGNPSHTKWVMYGASGTYMTGTFDGERFAPEHGKYFYTWGSQYAAQTYNNVPDGRRIQIGWGRIDQKGMPFNQMMLFPCELSLRTTPDGVRLFCEPVREIESLHLKKHAFSEITGAEANDSLNRIKTDLLHVKADIEIVRGLGFEIFFRGSSILNYDGNFGRFNNAPYVGEVPGSLRFNVELIIDRTTFEAYIGKGRLFIPEALREKKTEQGLSLRGEVKIHSMEIYEMASIWK